MIGICSYGGYIPRYRLNRRSIYQAMGWLNPGTIAFAKGEKAVASYDEDSITMAVAAGIDCLKEIDRSEVEAVYFASTTMPYAERLNSGIITAALGLSDHLGTADFGGGRKAGTTALLSAIDTAGSGRANRVLVCASDCRLGKSGSPQEMVFGDAGAALLVGNEDVIAEFKGSYSITYDFGDHFRGYNATCDRQWEDRWIRTMGFEQFIPEIIQQTLGKYDMKISDFARVLYPCHYDAARKKINKLVGITSEQEQPHFQAEIGETGTPHTLVMLISALETAKPGDKILVVSYGSGCDSLIFQVTEHHEVKGKNGISDCLSNREDLDSYMKYLFWRGLLNADEGMRAEQDLWTRWSALWRSRKLVLGLWGSKCTRCGTPQLPPQKICVNPDCGAINEYGEYLFSDKRGHLISYTGDMLAASPNPPAIYGQVEFEGGGKFLFDFTDCVLDELSTGLAVSMSFRRKYYDKLRDISGYFWKAVPVREVN